MSNNKQNMKLYTEEQVLKMLEVCLDSDLYEHILTFQDILKTETPIELPSDEEIEKGVNCSNLGLRHDYSMSTGFKKGAKWMRDKIQGGNNEQQ